MAAMASLSSCPPHIEPPMAHAPSTTGVISRSLVPSRRVSMARLYPTPRGLPGALRAEQHGRARAAADLILIDGGRALDADEVVARRIEHAQIGDHPVGTGQRRGRQ